MIWAVKEELGCCFTILTTNTYTTYTALKAVPKFVII